MNNSNTTLEKVSSEIHSMWISWAKKMVQEEKNISKERIERWEKECFLPYQELSQEMKEMDRKFAKRIIKIVREEN